MTVPDPVLDDLQRMFACFEGPPAPALHARAVRSRRGPRARRLVVLVGIVALLAGASVAAARQLDLFDGSPAPDSIKQEIATSSLGAPPALDPGIAAEKTVVMIRVAVAKGTAILYVSPSRNPDYRYCMGVGFSWLGDGKTGLGCMGPVDGALPVIDVGIEVPGRAGTSSGYIHGRINDDRATSVRFVLPDGSAKTVPLTHGYFLTELPPGSYPPRVEALDADGSVLATQTMQPVIGMPSP
jgi:hypothetical protein